MTEKSNFKRFRVSDGVAKRWNDRVLIAADTHLAPHAWKSHPAVAGDAYYAFEQIAALCALRRPQELWLAGDILDRVDIDPLTVRVLTTQLDILADLKIPVRFIVGQHERHRLAQWLNIHSWPTYMHMQTWTTALGTCYALDWQPRDVTQTSLAGVPVGTDVLLTHHVWTELHGKLMHPECALSDVHHATTIVSGDYHKAVQATGVNAQGAASILLSPGSTAMQSLNEPVEKSVLTLSRVGGELRAVRCPLRSRGYFRYVLEQPEDLEWLKVDLPQMIAAEQPQWSQLPEQLQLPIVVVEYPAHWPKVAQYVAEAVTPHAHLFARPQVTPTEIVELDTRRTLQLEGHLASGISLVAEPTEPHYNDLLSMLSCPQDPAALEDLLDNVLSRVAQTVQTEAAPRQRRRERAANS